MHFSIFFVFTNHISVFCLFSFSLDINASFNEKAVLCMKFHNDERKISCSTKKCHIPTTKFLRDNRIGLKAQTIAVNATYSASLKGSFIL